MIKELTLHNRAQQVIQAITNNNVGLDTAARKKKFQAMSESPYRFFRGTSHLFWQDMYNDWRFALFGGWSGNQSWIQGDAHVYNFGAFGNHDGEVVYGLDDFDDAVVSDYQYDLWRLAVSLVLDTRGNGIFDGPTCTKALEALAKGYLETATRYHEDDLGQEVHFTADTTGKPLKKFLKKVAKKKGRKQMLDKWTRLQKNGKRVLDATNPKLKRLSPTDRKALLEAFETYRQERMKDDESCVYRVKDAARRMNAGTSSLANKRFYILIEGKEGSQDDDIILDLKQQRGPSLLNAMTDAEREGYQKVYQNEGIRHLAAFEAMAEHPDSHLGWLELDGMVFSVRERSPFKKDFKTHKIDKEKHFYKMAATWGEVLATEHKRASRYLNPDQPFLFEESLSQSTEGREDEFATLVMAIANHYAECVERDFETFLGAF
ncbi:DUF2252 family protein [Marinobacter subterrani]|uniref:Putative conserved protein, DUF2252 family n=1 Tax=Marinobacter subterrani TaxID=1658765 RepID=A0A0J7J8Q2_9GAMM|nr:DUF2252 family protein [Marinobacter subterrani]KMQ74286.1 putative conserved protein, DUF2252 family [Marinobacter subterrani]